MLQRNEKGISLFEVLVSVVILSAGIIAVYRPMMQNVSVLHDAEHRVIANRISQNEIWKIQEKTERLKKKPEQESQIITDHNKVFTQSFIFKQVSGFEKLYQIDAVTSWQTGARIKQIKRVDYVSTA